MTSQLSKEIKTHIVITINKNKYFITSQQEIFLRTAEMRDSIYTDKGMFKVHQITEILPIEEYYNNNPEERPQYDNYPKISLPATMKNFTPARHKKAIDCMAKGFKKHFGTRPIPPVSQKMLDQFVLRLN